MYVWYAERYRWTPEQVDALPAWLDSVIPDVAALFDEVREDAQEQAQRDAERKANR
ncbi:hypothetical protein ABZ883_40580 [Streptomyces sp. NPDC046977]|uniref:hypothetical protein n=1 Tax=Streptomyces sp. NPDC046977 TaxID=3154703 RepID=UPI0033D96AA8